MKNHVYHSSKMFIIVGQTDIIALLLHSTYQFCRITSEFINKNLKQ